MKADASIGAPAGAEPDASARLEAIDALRGLALVGMFVFHFVWDLGYFGFVASATPRSPGFMLFGHVVASTFLALAGASFVLATRSGFDAAAFGTRLARIVAAAAAVSAATYIAFPERFIFFGILHCIALASIVALPLRRAPLWLVTLAAATIIAAPLFIVARLFDAPALWWVGLGHDEPPTNDWRPFFPWVGFTIAGVALMQAGVSRGLPRWLEQWRARNRASRALVFGGRHSLLVYLLHQPVLLALVYAATLVASPEEANYRRTCEAQCTRAGAAPPFCADACLCVTARLKRDSLWRPVLRNSLTPAENEAFRALSRQCAREAAPQ